MWISHTYISTRAVMPEWIQQSLSVITLCVEQHTHTYGAWVEERSDQLGAQQPGHVSVRQLPESR